MKKIVTLLMLILFSSSILVAGNSEYEGTNMPSKGKIGELPSVKANYRNINNDYAVTNMIFTFILIKVLTEQPVYTKTVELDELPPMSSFSADFGDEYKSALEPGEKYTLEFSTTQDYDEDESNNSGVHYLEITDEKTEPVPDIINFGIDYFNKGKYIPYNSTQKVTCPFFNRISDASATNVNYYLEIKDSTGKTIHKVTVKKPTTIGPFEGVKIDFGAIPKSVFDSIAKDPLNKYPYTFLTYISSDADENRSSDTARIKQIFKKEVSLDDVFNGLKKEIEKKEGSKANKSVGYYHNETLQPGTKIKSKFENVSIDIESESWVGWIDYEPTAKFEHSTSIYTYNISTSELTIEDANWYPVIVESDGTTEILTEDVRIIGDSPDLTSSTPLETISSTVTPSPKDRVCALLISGIDEKKPDLQKSFENDLDMMKKNLMSEELGPQLAESNIRVEKGISDDEIMAILTSMKDKYDKVYFFYSGHGSKTGRMCTGKTKDDWYSYENLMYDLNDIGAKDYCILVDACYSGTAKTALNKSDAFSSSDVSLVTSSNDKKVSYTNYSGPANNRVGYGLYTLNFLKCFGEPAADKDKKDGTDYREAYEWVKVQKPKDTDGDDLDSLQCATYSTKSNGLKNTTEKSVNFHPGTDVVFYNVDGAEQSYEYTATMSLDVKEYDATDKRIIDISGTRTWILEADGKNKDFMIDIEFQLRDEYESLTPGSMQLVGMVWREDENDSWKPQYPSVHNLADNKVLCGDTDHFSEWAAGIITANPTSVDSKFLINNVEYGPNPFKNLLNFEFNLDRPEVFSIVVVDITGKRMDFIGERQYNRGSFNVNLDGSRYLPGTYYCRLVSDSGVRTIKLVKE